MKITFQIHVFGSLFSVLEGTKQTPIEHLQTFIHSWIPHPESQVLHNKLMFQIAFQSVVKRKMDSKSESHLPDPTGKHGQFDVELTMDSMIIFRMENPYLYRSKNHMIHLNLIKLTIMFPPEKISDYPLVN